MSDQTRHSGDPRIGLRPWHRPDLERKRIARVWRVTALCDASWSTFRDESEARSSSPGLKQLGVFICCRAIQTCFHATRLPGSLRS
jgi:hypothetical protein